MVLIRSERGVDTFRTWLEYVGEVVLIGSERIRIGSGENYQQISS